MRAAAGFSDHTGWAIAVVLAGDASAPTVVVRRRIGLLDPGRPRQVFHEAAETPVANPWALISQSARVGRGGSHTRHLVPPWQKEHREAACAAWLTLAS